MERESKPRAAKAACGQLIIKLSAADKKEKVEVEERKEVEEREEIYLETTAKPISKAKAKRDAIKAKRDKKNMEARERRKAVRDFMNRNKNWEKDETNQHYLTNQLWGWGRQEDSLKNILVCRREEVSHHFFFTIHYVREWFQKKNIAFEYESSSCIFKVSSSYEVMVRFLTPESSMISFILCNHSIDFKPVFEKEIAEMILAIDPYKRF
jgi:hypothetical protein